METPSQARARQALESAQHEQNELEEQKRAFLDQLHDKIASLKTNNSASHNSSLSRRFSKNKSDVAGSESATSVHGEAASSSAVFSDDTQLVARFAFGDGADKAKNGKAKATIGSTTALALIDDDDEENTNPKALTNGLKRRAIGSKGMFWLRVIVI